MSEQPDAKLAELLERGALYTAGRTTAAAALVVPRLHDASPGRVVATMPANRLFLPLIALVFPNARLIVM